MWILSLGYLGFYLKRGWIPHDEGLYGQSAERLLLGELPHRDFDENYTGGLTLLNAVALRALGFNLGSIRMVLFAVFALWVPCVYYIASRFISPALAGAVTLLCVAWSTPNYTAAVPSWYNLFFAVFGIGALLRHLEVGSRRWLFIAGLCGGFSILAKITGLYFVAAVLLFFVFREQGLGKEEATNQSKSAGFFRVFLIGGLTLFLMFLTKLILSIPGVGGIVYFVIPTAILVSLLLYREFAGTPSPSRGRFINLARMVVPFAAGRRFPSLFSSFHTWFLIQPLLYFMAFSISQRSTYFLPEVRHPARFCCWRSCR